MSVISLAFVLGATAALANPKSFNIDAEDAPPALLEFGRQSAAQILFASDTVKGVITNAVHGNFEPADALRLLVKGTKLIAIEKPDGVLVVTPGSELRDSRTAHPVSVQTDSSTSRGTRPSNPSRQHQTRPSVAHPDRQKLEEITVTSQRYAEKLDRVPISVTAYSQKSLDDLHVRTLADLGLLVPGLIVSGTNPGTQDASDVAIRGIFSNGNAPTTQFYIDETPIAIRVVGGGPSGSPRPLIFDLDRVEVLRGPQGTLFGSSAMGGAIRYITPQPDLSVSSGYGKADFSITEGGAPSYEAGLAYGAPVVTGTAAFRVSAWFQSEGGFIDKEDPFSGNILRRNANSSDSYVIRPAFTWALAQGLTITPAVFVQHFHSQNPSAYWINYLPAPVAGSHASGAIQQPLTDNFKVSSVAIKYDSGELTFQSDTAYLSRDSRAIDDYTNAVEYSLSGNPFIPGLSPAFHDYFDDSSSTRALQQEFRLSSQDPAAAISWVGGLYFRRARQGIAQCLPGSLDLLINAIVPPTDSVRGIEGIPDYTLPDGRACNAYTNYRTTDISQAVFGQVTFAIAAHLRADVGVRVEHAVVEDQHQILAGPLNGVTYFEQVLPDQKGNPITPRFGLDYQYTDSGMVYVSAAKGYRAGGGNADVLTGNPLCTDSLNALGLTTAPSTFNSDTLWSYEIGAKDTLFDRRLAIQTSAFLIDWSNIQTTVQLPSCAGGFTANRGKVVSRGFDLQLAAIVMEGFKLGANVGYTHAYYPNAAYGAPNTPGGVPPLLNAAGDKLAGVLEWTAAATAEYSRNLAPLWGTARSYLRLDYRWLGAANALNPGVAGYDSQIGPHQDPAYGVLNLRVGVVHAGLDISAYVNNLTRADPVLGYGHDSTGDPQFYAAAIQPLTAGVTAYYRF